MKFFSRNYQSEDDYKKIKYLLKNIALLDGPPFHGSTADLDFWTTVLCNKNDLFTARMWFNQNKDAVGFAWPDGENIDIFIHPDFKTITGQVINWAEKNGINNLKTALYCQSFTRESYLNNILLERGYSRTESFTVHFEHAINTFKESVNIPGNYRLKKVSQLEDIEEKIKSYKLCFPDHNMTKVKYISMMKTSSYNADLDLVIVAPDKTVASFAQFWICDGLNTGIVEPLGCHPEHRRRGLSKTLLLQGLKLLKTHGISKVYVKTSFKNKAAISLYKSTGFNIIDKEYVWEKKLR